MIVYCKNMKNYYYLKFDKKGLLHKIILPEKLKKDMTKTINKKKEFQQDFCIPYKYVGGIYDNFKLFDNFTLKGKTFFRTFIKKSFYTFFIVLLLLSIYYNPKNLFIYSIIYLIGITLYLFYKGNKNYLFKNDLPFL